MRNIIALLIRYAAFLLFIVLEFFCINLIIRNNEGQKEIFLNSSSVISGKIQSQFNRLVHLFSLASTVDSLSSENARLRAELANARYSLSLDTSSVVDTIYSQQYTYVHALVENKSISLRNNMITINKGSLQGIRKDMGIIEPNGIVGIVEHVGRHYSSCISVLNSRFIGSVAIKRTQAFGNLVWKGVDPTIMQMEAVGKHEDIRKGDTVVTTPFSNHFPQGIPVGTIVEANLPPGNNFYELDVRLFNNLSRTTAVYVVQNLLKNERKTIENPQETTGQ